MRRRTVARTATPEDFCLQLQLVRRALKRALADFSGDRAAVTWFCYELPTRPGRYNLVAWFNYEPANQGNSPNV